MNTKTFEKMNYGLYLVGAAAGGKRQGCIVSSFAQVTSSKPAKFTVTLNRDHETCKAVAEAGSFAVTMLAETCPKELVSQFGYKSGRVGDKFSAYDAKSDQAGNPYLIEGMTGRVSCKVIDRLEIGNYVLFVGEVLEAEVLTTDSVLTLENYTNRDKKPVPPSATVYRTVEINGYRCTICGYVHEGENLPEDFICPICRAKADKFEKIEK